MKNIANLNFSNIADTISIEIASALLEFKKYVKYLDRSTILANSLTVQYINLITYENENYCIRLNINGWCIVSNTFDDDRYKNSSRNLQYFETLGSLLDNVSLEYRKLFSEHLNIKLHEIKN
ncbi:unnamed protein product [Gordionus sp. m RMFG-2023]